MPRGEGIKPLGSLFEKYKQQLVAPQGSVIKCFIEVVAELYNLNLTKEQVQYSTYNKTITLRVAGPLKTEILIHKTEVLAHLKGRLGEKAAPQNIL